MTTAASRTSATGTAAKRTRVADTTDSPGAAGHAASGASSEAASSTGSSTCTGGRSSAAAWRANTLPRVPARSRERRQPSLRLRQPVIIAACSTDRQDTAARELASSWAESTDLLLCEDELGTGEAGPISVVDFDLCDDQAVIDKASVVADGRGFDELRDLPDNALAKAFFTGFLNSIQVATCLRVLSKRLMAIASDSCEVMDLHGLTIGNQDLASVTGAFPHLKEIDLSFCKGLSGGLMQVLRPCRHTLQTLSLRGSGASDAMIDGLQDFQELVTLDLCQSTREDTQKLSPEGLEALASLHRLEKLGLAWNKLVTDDFIELLCGATYRLVELDLALCDKITSRSVKALATQRGLRTVSVQACRALDDDGIEALTLACPGLTSLDLAHLPLITRQCFEALVRLRDLRKLDVRCCELISTGDVAAFKSAQPYTSVAELRVRWS